MKRTALIFLSILCCQGLTFAEPGEDSTAVTSVAETGEAGNRLDSTEALDSVAAETDGEVEAAEPAAMRTKVLDSLEIRGLLLNSRSIVYNNIQLRQGKPFTTNDVKESIRKLSGLNLFRTIDVFVAQETDTSATLLLQLDEFPFCEAIEYAGLKKIKAKDFEEKLPIKVRQIVTDNDVFRTEQFIKKQYAEKGYLLAEVKAVRVASRVPGNTILKFVVTEGPKVQIKQIKFKGNVAIKEKKLKSKFKTREDRWWRSGDYDEDLFRAHIDTLIMYYNDLGYLDAAIVNDSVWYLESKKDIGIEITLEEGKKYYTGKFDFTGNTVIPTDSLAAKILLKEGKYFTKLAHYPHAA